MSESSRAVEFLLNNWRELLLVTIDHLVLVLVATLVAILIGLPLGIVLTRRRRWRPPVLGAASVLQTIPSLALFGLLIPLPLVGGIGARVAIVALVVYALLPILRNTVTGIESVDKSVREAAIGLGMTDRQLLWQIELPLAANVILAGVRVATIVSIGVATIAAFIGAGGLGIYIQRGLRMNDNVLLLAGAIPAALMALLADWGLSYVERRSVGGGRVQRELQSKRNVPGWAAACVVVLLFAGFALWRGGAVGSFATFKNESPFVVGSKDFTESVILGELIAQTLEAGGIAVERRFELGGNLAHDALVANRIDIYPEYTGTALMAILKLPPTSDAEKVYEQIEREYAARFGVAISRPLGFSNDFAILVRGETARRLNLRLISDLAPHAGGWQAGFGQDFMSRPDGYAGFVRAYDLHFKRAPREMDLSLTYRALAAGEVDVIAGNSTDGLIAALDLVQLEDDRNYFPPYQAVLLVREDALQEFKRASALLRQLEGAITTEEMRRLNYEVDARKRDIRVVVREWRQGKMQAR